MKNKTCITLFCCFLLSMYNCCALFAQSGKIKVIVYVVDNSKKSEEGVADVFANKLVEAIMKNEQYTAIESSDAIQKLMSKSQARDLSGIVDIEKVAAIGKQYGAKFVCGAEIKEVLGSKYITARLVDVESAEIIESADKEGNYKEIKDLINIADNIAKELLKNENLALTKCAKCAVNGSDLFVTPNDAGIYKFDEARNICSKYGQGWVVPSVTELQKIYINKEKFGFFQSESYWSKDENGSGDAKSLNFANGKIEKVSKRSELLVRCVKYK